jgi:hypothetical protein
MTKREGFQKKVNFRFCTAASNPSFQFNPTRWMRKNDPCSVSERVQAHSGLLNVVTG